MTKNILLVDDDSDFLASTGAWLSKAGYDVTTADGVAQARGKLAERLPDAAVIDLMMEEADGGFTLCRHIKNLDARLPVIMVTAVTSETGLNFKNAAGDDHSWIKADALLAKPVRFEQLKRELDRLLKD